MSGPWLEMLLFMSLAGQCTQCIKASRKRQKHLNLFEVGKLNKFDSCLCIFDVDRFWQTTFRVSGRQTNHGFQGTSSHGLSLHSTSANNRHQHICTTSAYYEVKTPFKKLRKIWRQADLEPMIVTLLCLLLCHCHMFYVCCDSKVIEIN